MLNANANANFFQTAKVMGGFLYQIIGAGEDIIWKGTAREDGFVLGTFLLRLQQNEIWLICIGSRSSSCIWQVSNRWRYRCITNMKIKGFFFLMKKMKKQWSCSSGCTRVYKSSSYILYMCFILIDPTRLYTTSPRCRSYPQFHFILSDTQSLELNTKH